jgi:hypothetical protein
MKMFTIDNEIENRIKEQKAKTISEKRISPHVVQIQMEIAILELKRQRLLEEIAQLKTRLRKAEKREKST